ncbi:DUF302 domain-containing protein [Citrobacter freundii]|nr:DUF302 domain-containing protein [Citrobacter freundii]ELK6040388.1 DUF302 domain-containing protein [Citrobacter freundii]
MLRSLKNIFITAALYLLMTVTSHAANTGNTMIKTYSTYNYQQTREHLIAAIESNNLVFFGEFDHAKEAKNAGLTMLPTTVIIFGNPKGGTSLMQAYPDMALDLPFRVLIREESDGRVVVGYHPVEILQTYGPDTAAIQSLKNLEKLVQKAIQ